MAANPEVIVFAVRGVIHSKLGPGLPRSLADRTQTISQATEAELQSILGSSIAIRCALEFPPPNTSLRGSVILGVNERNLSDSDRSALAQAIESALTNAANRDPGVMNANVLISDLRALAINYGQMRDDVTRRRPPVRERRGIGLAVALLIGIAVSDVQWLVTRSGPSEAPTPAVVSNAAASAGTVHSSSDLQALYARSVEEAAVHTPDMRVNLHPVVDDPVRMVSFSLRSPVEQAKTRNYTWVSQAADLIAFCKRASDPLLAVQQTLGLPPSKNEDDIKATRAFVMLVRKTDIFRPCVSSTDIATTSCETDAPDFRVNAQADTEERRMVMTQLWRSHKRGFSDPGYPFTGMGWTYNWNPSSGDHIGVSEYVVRPGANVESVQAMTPADFCAATF
jgi:hypothetical protein